MLYFSHWGTQEVWKGCEFCQSIRNESNPQLAPDAHPEPGEEASFQNTHWPVQVVVLLKEPLITGLAYI